VLRAVNGPYTHVDFCRACAKIEDEFSLKEVRMPLVTFSSKTMPESGETLWGILQNALDKASPIEDFIQVVRDLTRFELQHQLGSQEFFERFQQGEMGDRIEYMRWANKYEIYQEIKDISEVLQEIDAILYSEQE
jgi:transcriptional regulator NrdR family protein